MLASTQKPKMQRGYGNWVTGNQFYDREAEMSALKELLREGSHVLIVAQRRMGKTSLMREAARQLDGEFLCLHVDLQRSASAADAVLELGLSMKPHVSLWNRISAMFANLLDQVAGRVQSIKKSDVSVALRVGINETNWRAKGDRLLEILSELDRHTIIFLDELPVLINRLLRGDGAQITAQGKLNAEAFMSWLRCNSIRYQGKIRFVVTGSIGLHPILRQAGITATANNFMAFPLPPWSKKVAAEFLAQMAADYGLVLGSGVAEYMADLIGYCIPHYIRMFFHHVKRNCECEGLSSVSKEFARRVYEENMLGVHGRAELSHYEERLRLLGERTHQLAVALLTETASTGYLGEETAMGICRGICGNDGAEEQLREVLNVLEHDCYIERRGDRLEFVSNLVRDWWFASYGSKRRKELKA